MNTTLFIGFFLLLVSFLLLRLYPIWPARHQGCDAYNILLNAECFRSTWKLPIRVPPLFMLEEQDQWYPPGFLVFCALFPQRWLKRNYWLVNHLVDFCSATMVWVAAQWLGLSAEQAFVLVVFYAIATGPVSEFVSLNVRPFGLTLFHLFMFFGLLGTANPAWLWACFAVGIMLFYSHKLSLQQLWFTVPVIAIATGPGWWWLMLPAVYLGALVVWRRGGIRVLKGHVAIVRFWHQYWPLLGAHSVRQSPVLGDGHTDTTYYASSTARHPVSYLKDIFHQNYYVVPAVAVLFVQAPLEDPIKYLAAWLASVYVAVVCIHFVTKLRAIGLARQYVKFALVPSLLISGYGLVTSGHWLIWGICGGTALLAIRQYLLVVRYQRSVSAGGTAKISTELDGVLKAIADDEEARCLVLPVHLCDLVAYQSRRPVYWGTHSDIFDNRLAEFFPVLKRPLEWYLRDGVNRVLIDRNYVDAPELGLDARDAELVSGPYLLFHLESESSVSE